MYPLCKAYSFIKLNNLNTLIFPKDDLLFHEKFQSVRLFLVVEHILRNLSKNSTKNFFPVAYRQPHKGTSTSIHKFSYYTA